MADIWKKLGHFCDKTGLSEADRGVLISTVGEERDRIYRERNIAVAVAATAVYNNITCAVSRGKDDSGNDVVYIYANTAQFSWHVHSSDIAIFENVADLGIEWDGTFNGKDPQKAKEILDYASRF